MRSFLEILSKLGLQAFYLDLTPQEKGRLQHYARSLCAVPTGDPHLFPVESPACFLWAVAANAMPAGDYILARKALEEAQRLARDAEDLARVNLNLAQLYLDLCGREPEAEGKYLHYRAQLAAGPFARWASCLPELTVNGQPHEIYLSDPRRTAPEKLKTTGRLPVR